MLKMKSFELAKFLVLIFVVVISIDGIRANSLFNLEEMLIKGMTDALERMDNAIYEMNNRITRLENKVGMDGSSSDKNGQTVKTEPKTAEISFTLRETKRNFIKAMSVEKQILRESMHNYENKWNNFKSDVKGVLGDMNTTMGKSIEHLNKKIEENAELQIESINTNNKDLSTAVERINVIDNDVAKLDVKYGESIKVLGEMNSTMEKSIEHLNKKIEENAELRIMRIDTNTKDLSTAFEIINVIDNDVAKLDVKYGESIKVLGEMNSTMEKANERLTGKIEIYGKLHIEKINTNAQVLSTVVERINTIDNDIALLDIKYDDVASKVRNLDSRINTIDSVSKATERSIGSLTSRINDLHGIRIGFSVDLSSTKKYRHEETIVFDRVFSSYGGNYDSSTGKFTVPKTGMYFFSFSVHGTKSHYAIAQLGFENEDDYDFNHGAAARSDKGMDTTASGTWVKRLTKGTKVWIRSLHQSEFLEIYTSFRGILLDID